MDETEINSELKYQEKSMYGAKKQSTFDVLNPKKDPSVNSSAN
jgi:hypothetical protein